MVSGVAIWRFCILTGFKPRQPIVGFFKCQMQSGLVVRLPGAKCILFEGLALFLALDVLPDGFEHDPVEDLNLGGMVKNHNLARSLSDAGIGNAIQAIEVKAAMHGKTVIKIDRWFPSSKMCSACGLLQSKMSWSVRQWTCGCGAMHDRDENAARNIVAVGHTVTGRGAGVSPHC